MLVEDGDVEIWRDDGGVRRRLGVVHKGGFFGEMAENGGDKLVHGSGGISQRGRSKTLPPVAFDLF